MAGEGFQALLGWSTSVSYRAAGGKRAASLEARHPKPALLVPVTERAALPDGAKIAQAASASAA